MRARANAAFLGYLGDISGGGSSKTSRNSAHELYINFFEEPIRSDMRAAQNIYS